MTNEEIITGLKSLINHLNNEVDYWKNNKRKDMENYTYGRISMAREIIEVLEDDNKSN